MDFCQTCPSPHQCAEEGECCAGLFLEPDCGHMEYEVEHLRTALEKIADPSTSWGHMKLIARRALNLEK